MLYAKLRYGSLFTYAVKHLHYSEGAAMRRIDAMRMLKEMPELEPSIESGELTLTNLSLVKQASETHGKSTSEKRALLEEVKGKSKRECERILAREMSEMIPAEKERVLTETHTEVRVILNERQREKLTRLKALLSHKNPNPTYAELIEILSDLALKKIDPLEQKPKKKRMPGVERTPSPPNESTPPAEFKKRDGDQSSNGMPSRILPASRPASPPTSPPTSPRPKQIPRAFKRELFQAAGGKCSRCGSAHFLEIDHITPRAKGGTNEIRNLRVLCRSCNQYEAMRVFGPRRMSQYFTRLS